MNPLEIARNAAAAASDKKATRCVIIDLRGVSDSTDFHFICSGDNDRQTRAIAEAIEEKCKTTGGIKPNAIEGKQSGNWILMDYGSTLVHIFCSPIRDFYALESLWPNAKILSTNTTTAKAD
jgi:ribosome-associated protein